MSARRSSLAGALTLAFGLSLAACGEDPPVVDPRVAPGQKPAAKAPSKGDAGTRRSSAKAPVVEPMVERPDRPRPILTRDDFSGRARDPFHNYNAAAESFEAAAPVEIVRKQREVKLGEYPFDDLRLIAIVNASRNVAPRALFLAGDNKSKSVRQGEYFSSAEVLLASVNRDYIEIEVIDPELTPGWNLERGERKVIYLKRK
jgi:Tfp pilus assembly protein PilP